MKKYNRNSENKRELHPAKICAILFFFALFFSLIIVGNSYKASKATGMEGSNILENDNQHHNHENILVVIDPGHGGYDPGKVGVDGTLEKDINLQISMKLKDQLVTRGINSKLIRETDTGLATEGATNKKSSDMKNRISVINESQATVLISVHQNSFTDPSVRGPQVFYYGTSQESEIFAKLLQENLKAINPEYAREAKMGNDYYILNKSVCPGVIVECGFLSCPEEAALLASDEYQEKIASAIADAIEENY